nr:MAG TPA: hypothetical protein [Bacteriophage sp.]DAQ24434.1 MAG TPA: hypothetical protein [Caudoviricetes sp.]
MFYIRYISQLCPKGNIKSFGVISKLCDVKTNTSMRIA